MNIDVVFNIFESLQCNVQTPVDLLRIKCLLFIISDQQFVTILLLGEKWKNKDKLMDC